MKKTLKLCLSILTLSIIFSFVGNFDTKDFSNIIDDSEVIVSEDEIEQSAGEVVIAICKRSLAYICEDEPEIYYDSNILTVKLSERDSNKADEVRGIIGNIVFSEINVITE